MAWVANLCRWGGGVVGSVDSSQRGWSDFTSGWRPRMSWCGGRGLRVIVLFSVGCEQSSHAALQLNSEWWYVVMAVPEGGVGGLHGA